MAKKIDHDKFQKELFNRIEGYAANIRALYSTAFNEIIRVVKNTELEDDKPFNFADYGYTEDVQPILRRLYSQVYQTVRGGVEKEWLKSNEHTDELVKSLFGPKSIEDSHFAKYFQRNHAAMDAFFARKSADGGLNLSQRIWKYTGRFKEELEDTLDLAIGEGTPAMKLATKVKQYLNDPDRYYRRFRYKVGVDEEGNPKYGLKWKRRIFDKTIGLYQWIDDDPGKYHPGRGMYRSSARNAQRLARTEINMAYRTADYDRWQNLDFVIGVEIKLSNNHPEPDICDDLQGVYPKDFKWTGWHPQCRCYMVPVLANQDEVDRMTENILEGKNPRDGVKCSGELEKMPDAFDEWLKLNEDRVADAKVRGTLPYFISDNSRIFGVISYYKGVEGIYGNTKLGRSATKNALADYEQMDAITLSQDQELNIKEAANKIGIHMGHTMTFMEANKGRANIGYGENGYSENCQSTVVIHEARLRGLNITALPYLDDKNSFQYLLGEDFRKAWKNKDGKTPQITKINGRTDDEIIAKLDKQTLVPGRYHVGINLIDNTGHILTAERLPNGKLYYYDPQSGFFVNITEYTDIDYIEVLKVDKLLFDTDILKGISKII